MTPSQANGPPLETLVAFKHHAQDKSLANGADLISSTRVVSSPSFQVFKDFFPECGWLGTWDPKPPKATAKPCSRHILGIYSGVQSHPKATPKPPQSHPKATPKPPQSHPKATLMRPSNHP